LPSFMISFATSTFSGSKKICQFHNLVHLKSISHSTTNH
jgi:hypothetical protein